MVKREARCITNPTFPCKNCPITSSAQGVTDRVPQATYDQYVNTGRLADAGDPAAQADRQAAESEMGHLLYGRRCGRLNP